MRAKNIPAADASTGEQKALLIGLVLAHAGLLAEMSGFAPVLLLDEVVAHLDPSRRAALYAELETLGAQVWMTGADAAAFAEIAARADVLEVTPGQVQRTNVRCVMRAAYYEANGAARDVLRVAEVETPKPGPGEVRVRLTASGVNPSDVKSRAGINRKIAFPRVIPHSDGAGEIDARRRRRARRARRRAGVGLERAMAAPIRHRRAIDRAAGRAGGAAACQHRHGGRRLSRHSGLHRLSGGGCSRASAQARPCWSRPAPARSATMPSSSRRSATRP